jgi:hypothetical protein
MSFTENNHYVPQWYQKRFIPAGAKEQKLYYLDLSPDKVIHPDGKFHYRNEMRFLGTVNCFVQEHLYTQFFGNYATDVIEKRFFGRIDNLGATAVDFFSNYSVRDVAHEAFQNFGYFLNAQKLRTPKGLDFLRLLSSSSHQNALRLMEQIYLIHGTIWSEGVWQILECDQSDTKFIISDHPVTTYNKKLFPALKESQYPFDAPIEQVGTHTIFPLNLNRCLVITNLEYVRFPGINPLKVRENARYFDNTLFDLTRIQTGRQISQREVRAINYIIKRRARRFIAAATKEWLYPEKFLKSQVWNKLGDKFFLMPDPRKVTFTTEITAGWGNGSVWRTDEYGRRGIDDDKIATKRAFESKTFFQSWKDWDNEFGPLSRDELKRFF